ncbi:hypothetical protein GCM10010300_76460 [Streptomyces olivaceoviridis]|nr:hypothetical protein GCM10010300_76460 [Streptomyces olivaceoviridis]
MAVVSENFGDAARALPGTTTNRAAAPTSAAGRFIPRITELPLTAVELAAAYGCAVIAW